MLETAYLKYRFGFFPLTLSFHLQSFLSFALFAPSPKYALILQLLPAMPLHHSNKNTQMKAGEIKTTYSWIMWMKIADSSLPGMWNSTLGVSLFKKKTPQQCAVVWLLPLQAEAQETEIRRMWSLLITWWHKGGHREAGSIQSSELLLVFSPRMEEMLPCMVSPSQFCKEWPLFYLERPLCVCGWKWSLQ